MTKFHKGCRMPVKQGLVITFGIGLNVILLNMLISNVIMLMSKFLYHACSLLGGMEYD